MIKSEIATTQGKQITRTQRKTTKHSTIEPKSRLNQQAADRETVLVRSVIILVLLLVDLLLGLLLVVWQDDTRDKTNMSTIECTQQDTHNEGYIM
jgi:CHASE3 domain sensor protein